MSIDWTNGHVVYGKRRWPLRGKTVRALWVELNALVEDITRLAQAYKILLAENEHLRQDRDHLRRCHHDAIAKLHTEWASQL